LLLLLGGGCAVGRLLLLRGISLLLLLGCVLLGRSLILLWRRLIAGRWLLLGILGCRWRPYVGTPVLADGQLLRGVGAALWGGVHLLLGCLLACRSKDRNRRQQGRCLLALQTRLKSKERKGEERRGKERGGAAEERGYREKWKGSGGVDGPGRRWGQYC
jgi:hypothetical protein